MKFIFATTEPHKLPITILSRCQRFDFRRIPLAKVVARLRYIVDREGITISDESLAVVARKGDGSMRDSLSVLDQVLAFCGETVNDDDVVSLLGVVDRRLLLEASAAVLGRDTRSALGVVARVDEFGYNMRQFCGELIDHFRNLTILRAVGDAGDLLDLSEAELQSVREQASSAPLEDLQRHVTILLRADGEIAHSGYPRLVLEMALVRMATLAPLVPVGELLDRLGRIEERGSGVAADARASWRPSPPPEAGVAPVPTRPAPSAPVEQRPRSAPAGAEAKPAPPRNGAPTPEPQRTGDEWADFVAFVKGAKPRIGTSLEYGSPLHIAADRLEIGFPENSFALSSLRDGDAQASLKALAERFFSTPMTVALKVLTGEGHAPPNLLEKKRAEDEQRRTGLKRSAESHPAVSSALEVFDGTLAEVTPLGTRGKL